VRVSLSLWSQLVRHVQSRVCLGVETGERGVYSECLVSWTLTDIDSRCKCQRVTTGASTHACLSLMLPLQAGLDCDHNRRASSLSFRPSGRRHDAAVVEARILGLLLLDGHQRQWVDGCQHTLVSVRHCGAGRTADHGRLVGLAHAGGRVRSEPSLLVAVWPVKARTVHMPVNETKRTDRLVASSPSSPLLVVGAATVATVASGCQSRDGGRGAQGGGRLPVEQCEARRHDSLLRCVPVRSSAVRLSCACTHNNTSDPGNLDNVHHHNIPGRLALCGVAVPLLLCVETVPSDDDEVDEVDAAMTPVLAAAAKDEPICTVCEVGVGGAALLWLVAELDDP
jgi:hypothetical protein